MLQVFISIHYLIITYYYFKLVLYCNHSSTVSPVFLELKYNIFMLQTHQKEDNNPTVNLFDNMNESDDEGEEDLGNTSDVSSEGGDSENGL